MRSLRAPAVSAFLALVPFSTALAQQSAAYFDAPVISIPAEAPGYSELFDCDGDGDLDAVGVDFDIFGTQVRVALFTNDGSGRLSSFWMVTLPAGVGTNRDVWPRVATGDANQDGRGDFAVATGQELWTFRGQAPGVPPVRTVHSEGASVYDAVLLDLDHDGADEVVGLTQTLLLVLHSNGAVSRHAFPTALYNPFRLERAEISGDAQDDLIVVGIREAYLYAWLGAGIAHYATFWHDLGLGLDQGTVIPGDVDGDGDLDLMAIESSRGTLNSRTRILERTGPAFWSLRPIANATSGSALVDLDGDSDLDLLGYTGSYSHSSGNFPVNGGGGMFLYCFNDGSGNFGAPQQIWATGARYHASAADLDADGDLDLVGGRSVYYTSGPLRTSPIQQLAIGQVLRHEIGDLEGDGDPDIAISLTGATRNDLDAGFVSSAAPLVLGAAPGEVLSAPGFPGDFDGDGDTDLVARGSIPSQPIAWRFLRNRGGSFHVEGNAALPGVELSLGSLAAKDCIVADADGDGLLDLACVPAGPFTPLAAGRLWKQNAGATPSFTQLLDLPDRRLLAIERFDPDALPDLILSHVVPSSFPHAYDTILGVRFGLGGGAFAPELTFLVLTFTGNSNPSLQFEDFDGDGDRDFIESGSPNIVRLNQSTLGNPSYTNAWLAPLPGSLLAVPTAAASLYPIDLDSDGWTDLAMSSGYSGFDLLRRVPGTPFDASGFVRLATQQFALGTPLDFDNDGDADLLGYAAVRSTRFNAGNTGSVRTIGTGSAGTGGTQPALSLVGPVRVGSTAELRLVGARGGSVSFLALGTSEVALPNFPTPGLTFYVGSSFGLFGPFLNGGPNGVAGAGSFRLPHIVDPSFAGVRLIEQVLIVDVGIPSYWVASNAIEVSYR